MQFKQIMVLNDGETFTNLDGCFIMAVPVAFELEEVEEAIRHSWPGDGPNGLDFSKGYVVTVFNEPDRLEGGEAPSQDVSNIPPRPGLTGVIGEPRKL